jgi:hypothetical protein
MRVCLTSELATVIKTAVSETTVDPPGGLSGVRWPPEVATTASTPLVHRSKLPHATGVLIDRLVYGRLNRLLHGFRAEIPGRGIYEATRTMTTQTANNTRRVA